MTQTRPSISTIASTGGKSRSRNLQSYQTPPLPSSVLSDTSTISTSSSESTISKNKDAELDKIREYLANDTSYLGHRSLLENVEWINYGRKWILAPKVVEGEEGSLQPAVLKWVGEVSPHNFWLYPCAGWNGERGPNGDWEKSSPFTAAKARANISRPNHPAFANDWKACIQNLSDLLDVAKKPNTATALSVIQGNEVRVRHSIFEEVCQKAKSLRTY